MHISKLLSFLSVAAAASAMALEGRSDVGGPCAEDNDCYGGANCCSRICKLGSCRMDGSCDADNDCYGWCHNNSGKCCIKFGKEEGTCNCVSSRC
ncbi:hypothetical protein BU26DRAFT_518503 [Trematosphaeria pertusa]|uniref:Uncharacterized protein n=1 Tax=Trematosphaeria pertusa TaxID=390896 RepID=A0A6A6IKF1_9PLEO|nr:uncharacterized protein BU26DRAFT_518503 [Trematosphaeria pertusa]KAF2250040.1 hypothetical protein BU26DRAFT_518503 [Trematosphaeria pertusa]